MNSKPFSIEEAYYLIIDLEATCSEEMQLFPREEMEIIEIGAVLLDATSLKIADSFDIFVKPVLHPELTPFCTELTTITQAEVDQAPGFREALRIFQDWFHPYGHSRFCSWGDYDRNQFIRDCHRHRRGYPFTGKHLNLRTAFSQALGIKKGVNMSDAMARLGIEVEGTLHRGIDDALNLTRLVQVLLSSDA